MGDHLPKTTDALRNEAIGFDELQREMCLLEIHCNQCDSVSAVLKNKQSFLRHELGTAEKFCRDCAAPLYYCADNPCETHDSYIPFSKSFIFPLDQQMKRRLDGLYLQDVVDTSIFLCQHSRQWPVHYSGDTLDCERVREIFRQHPEDCRVDLSDPTNGKIYLLYTVTSDGHDPFETFQYCMWDQWMVIHNQPVQCRTWPTRPFLMKIKCDGKKAANLKAHLQFSAMWKHRLATEGIELGPRKLFVTDSDGRRSLKHFENITVKGHMISYGGDCVDLSVVTNIMNHSNPNCRLTKFNISALRVSAHQLAYSVFHGLRDKEFRLLTSAESIHLVQGVVDAVGTSAYKATAQSCGAKGHNLFYEGVRGLPYGPVPGDRDATIPEMFRQGDPHKLRIHAHNCLVLALRLFMDRDSFLTMEVNHSIRILWRGGIQFYSYLTKNAAGTYSQSWSRFRITPAIHYILYWLLLDFDLPGIVEDKVAHAFFVLMYKFYHLLSLPNWSSVHETIAQELITIHLLAKELLFGLQKTPVSSMDLMAAVDARGKFGAYLANSELVDDMLFKTCNSHASKKQMGNVDNSRRFKDAYVEKLGLGMAYDFAREEELQKCTRMHFPCMNPSIMMAIAVGFSCFIAAESHEAYANLAQQDWMAQSSLAVRMFRWDSEEEVE